MNNRYENIGILKTENGRRYKKTIKYPLMERNINDTYLIGARHDRLDNLAFQFYAALFPKFSLNSIDFLS